MNLFLGAILGFSSLTYKFKLHYFRYITCLDGSLLSADWKTLKKYFPNLAREIEEKQTVSIPISGFRSDSEAGERIASKYPYGRKPKFWGYNPDVIDFIRRCDREEQALEIIEFLEKRGEISKEYASKLKRQLKEMGVRSFGSKKEPGWYFKEDPYYSSC